MATAARIKRSQAIHPDYPEVRARIQRGLERRWQFVDEARQQSQSQYAGALPITDFMKNKLKVQERFRNEITLKKGPNSVYPVPEMLMGMVTLYVTDKNRMSQFDELLGEVKLAETVELPQFFSEDTGHRLLERVKPRHLKQLKGVLEELVLENLPLLVEAEEDLELDEDVTGLPSRARTREGVKRGYCNGRRRRCQKLATASVAGMPARYDLLPGNSNGGEFHPTSLKLAVELCKRHPRGLVIYRHDAGEEGEERLRELEQIARRHRNFRYIVAVKGRAVGIQGALKELRERPEGWLAVTPGTRVAEPGVMKLYGHSPRKRRVVIVARGEPTFADHRESSPPRTRRPKRRVQYYGLVTNLRRHERARKRVFDTYHRRQSLCEFVFKDAKQSGIVGKFPSKKLLANAFVAGLQMLAYVMTKLFERSMLPATKPLPEVKTFRRRYVTVGGKNRDGSEGSHPAVAEAAVPVALARAEDRTQSRFHHHL
ncbi:MAG: transposase [Terriglobia bacterium]